MISSITPFDYLKQFKEVDEPTEKLVWKKIAGRITQSELVIVFEKGIAGEFGKFYKADAQTLIGWVEQYLKSKNSPKNYLETGLLSPAIGIYHRDYPQTYTDWHKEINKCYTAFLNGVSESNFHPHCYDRMVLDDKGIVINDYLKRLSLESNEENIRIAKQRIIKDAFCKYRDQGKTFIYFIQ